MCPTSIAGPFVKYCNMAETGYRQAIIAYKVSRPGGEPLDVNGELTRISKRKQAIALLKGYANPDPAKYEVEFYYNRRGIITGNPTAVYDIGACPAGYIRLTPSRIVLETSASASFVLESSGAWKLVSGPTDLIDIGLREGGPGRFEIPVRGSSQGDGYFVFRNEATGQTASLYVTYVSQRVWVLETGRWNMKGFWFDNGVWNY